MIDRLCHLAFQKKNTVAARWAAQTLSALVCQCTNPLIRIASVKRDTIGKPKRRCIIRQRKTKRQHSLRMRSPKEWAGESLARVYGTVQKHTKTLSAVNSAYRKARAKIGKIRRDIVTPARSGESCRKNWRPQSVTDTRCFSIAACACLGKIRIR